MTPLECFQIIVKGAVLPLFFTNRSSQSNLNSDIILLGFNVLFVVLYPCVPDRFSSTERPYPFSLFYFCSTALPKGMIVHCDSSIEIS